MEQVNTINGRPRRRYVARFAGEVFAHEHNPVDGPEYRKLVSTEAWKQPPSAAVRSEVSV